MHHPSFIACNSFPDDFPGTYEKPREEKIAKVATAQISPDFIKFLSYVFFINDIALD